MIRNYNELIICITNIEKQISKLKKEQQKHIFKLDFANAKTLLSQQQLLELQILNYIGYYQEKIKNNHLESKLYGEKLVFLKKSYQTKNIADDLLYCLKQLIKDYDELKNDLWIFSSLHLNHVLEIKEKIKKLIFTVEEIYFELTNLILFLNAKFNEKQIIEYNLIVDFFHNYYTSEIENLQDKLRSEKSGSKFIQFLKKLVNPATIKMIELELESKKETEEITIQLELLVATKERHNKLSKMAHKSI
ncbi:hypothetical protein [Flavobacterium anhuiense]|uniref:hypothetical protein n=1 Tax=Flavobacterium anhuiense TaxID=459526 RepID=UPI003D98468D